MDAQALKECFDLITPTKEKFTHLFYVNLFAHDPELRKLFVQDMYIQERSLAATLQMIVEAIEQGNDIQQTLYKLGLRHVTYGVKIEYYAIMGTTLLNTFQEFLGERFTPAMRQAWEEAYRQVSIVMQNAAIEHS